MSDRDSDSSEDQRQALSTVIALRESDARFRMLADNMSQLAWTCDVLGNVTWYNKRWLEYTGLTFEEMKGWGWQRVQHPDHVDRVVARVERSRDTGEPWEDTFPLRGKDGTYRWFLSRALPIRDEQGTLVQWFGTNTDVTEQKEAEEEVARQAQELRALNQRLLAMDRLKNQFFSNVSHEFRTPLTLMLGPLEDVLAKPAEQVLPKNRELLEVVHRNGLRLQKLVNTLLDFSRIEEGRVQAVYEATDLSALTIDLASNFRAVCDRAGLRLTVNCAPLGGPVYVDRDMWEKIVLNLLSNAFKFTLDGEISVTLTDADQAVQLCVQDTGTGIAVDQLPHIFDRFHRVEGARARTHEGTGIGLALVQDLAKLHRGRVDVRSVAGEGSTFTVTIPKGTSHLPTEHLATRVSTALSSSHYVQEALRWLPGAGTTEPPRREADPDVAPDIGLTTTDTPNARILIADDNADMREYVRRLLSDRYDVEAVADGVAALDAVRRRPPDLVLLDVMMPGLDGFAVINAMRADQRLTTVPVIMLSARAGEESQVEGLSAGADDYLVKPFSARELVARVAAHLALARVRRDTETRLREGEERLRLALNAGRMGTWEWDISSNRVIWSRELQTVHGLAPGSFAGTFDAYMSDVHPDDRELVIASIRQTLDEHRDHHLEYRLVLPNAEIRWVEGRGRLVCDVTGTPVRMVGVCQDITARKRAEAAATEQAAVTDKLNRVGATVASSLDRESVLQSVTDLSTELTTAEFGAFFYNVIDPKSGESYLLYTLSGASKDAFNDFPMPRVTALFGPTFRGEAVVRADDVTQDPRYGQNAPHYGMPPGHLPVRSYLAAPVKARSGEVLGGLFFGHSNVGMFTKQHEQLVEGIAAWASIALENAGLYAASEQARHAREDFLSAASHELRNPVNALQLQLIALLRAVQADDRPLSPEWASDRLGQAVAAARRLVELVETLLDVSRITAGRLDLDPEDMDFGKSVLAVVSRFKEQNGQIITRTGEMSGTWDRLRLEQIITNLVSNAVKYGEGSPIEVTLEGDESTAYLTVQDHGIGISPADQQRLFERFERAVSRRHYGGFGLGLWITRQIVDAMGGRVSVNSRPGEGSTFRVALPRRQRMGADGVREVSKTRRRR